MEITGKVVQKLAVESGMSKAGKDWRKQSVVIETQGEYPKKVCFTLWGNKIDEIQTSEGDVITAKIDIESREYNGRWYTDVKAWSVQLESGSQTNNEINQEPDVTSFGSQDGEEDLPF